MTVSASAPTRVDLAGGTIDIWPLYLFHPGAQTINAALTLRARVTISGRNDDRVVLASTDLGVTTKPLTFAALPAEPALPLLAKLAHAFDARGVTITTDSDAPAGAGIAGSSALNIAVAAALARWTGRALSDDALLALAQDVEAQVIEVPTGLQDYRPALYGGIASLELHVGRTRHVPLPVAQADLSARLVVCYTGAPRQSGINNWDITKRRIDGDAHVRACLDRIVGTTRDMRDALECGDWSRVGTCLADEWNTRKQLAPGVTTPVIDALLAAAVGAGAWAGKVCGAGGGGCLFVLAPPEATAAIARVWTEAGARVLDTSIDAQGVLVREDE